MAAENEKDLNTVLPEQNLAKLISERHGFKPGDLLSDLVKKYSGLEILEFPSTDIDGVSLNLKVPNRHPEILINKSISKTRQRFTLAHEFGHVIIPWHFGTIFSNIDRYKASADFAYREKEAEANRFAAELLMPRDWILSLLKDEGGNPCSVTEIVRHAAKTSLDASLIAVNNCLPKGFVYVCVDHHDRVVSSVKSRGTNTYDFPIGAEFSDSKIRAEASNEYRLDINRSHYWLYFDSTKALPEDDDPREWRKILEEILDNIGVDDDSLRQNTKFRLNGIISAANRKGISAEAFYAAARQRLMGRDKTIQSVVDHQCFDIFLVKRIREFVARRL